MSPELANASLKAMIGQMIILGFPGTRPRQEWPDRVATMIRRGQIGGTILFGSNVVDAVQVKRLIRYLGKANKGASPFVCIDQEGGAIQRLTAAKGFITTPSARDIAKMDHEAAYRLYQGMATQLATLGFNVNFGPVVDLDINPANPSIGRLARSYDRDAETVASFAELFVNAHKQSGIMTVVKHFPGHGSAQDDPHTGIVNIEGTWQEQELIPFRHFVNEASSMIMVGHLIHTRFSDGDRPASLSKQAISTELRSVLGFQGLVITDDIEMGAIRERYKIEEAAVLAISAGADLIVIANNERPDTTVVERVTSAILQAIQAGQIKKSAVKRSHDRIVTARLKLPRRAN
jgi:beta-N-acetylhexosaminidase